MNMTIHQNAFYHKKQFSLMDSIYLPLHHGKAPYWLLNRMKKLAEPIIKLILMEYGEKEFIKRISDPIFFQSFSNVLGFDWNSSGSTTVLTGVLKSVLNKPEYEIRIAGGKGENAIKTIDEIEKFGVQLELNDYKINELKKLSRLLAKIDNVALQDGYNLYHHTLIFSKKYWCIIQQGMNERVKLARRYHHSFEKEIQIEEPHKGIISERREKVVMNLTSKKSGECRRVILDLISDGRFKTDYKKLISITKYRGGISLPKKIDWSSLEKAYNLSPENFEELLLIKGIGKNTIRALSLISELIYDAKYDKKDPTKFCFALGGKDGVPFPVNTKIYDEVIEFLKEAVKQAELSKFEKVNLLKKLSDR